MEWDEYAATWDGDDAVRSYAAAAFGSLMNEATRRGVELAGSRALDFGCGTGLLTERLVDTCASVDALDASPRMLEVVQAKVSRNGWATVRTIDDLAGTSPPYDLIVCSSVCSFLDDYPAAAAQLGSLLSAGGLFVQWDWELDPQDADPHGLSRETIREALIGAGLTSVTVDTGFRVPFDDQTMSPLMGAGIRP